MRSEIQSKVDEFESRLGLAQGFYNDLLNEDDWSFVIKISALIEAACTHILSYKVRYPDLEDNFTYLEQGNKKVGRVALLKKIGALYENQTKALYALAELRNSLAHDVRNTNFRFDEHMASLDANQKRNFIAHFGQSLREEIDINGTIVRREQFVIENPKLGIWFTCHEIIACLYIEIELTDADTKLASFGGLAGLAEISRGS